MRARYSPEAEACREKVQAFPAEHLPAAGRAIGGRLPGRRPVEDQRRAGRQGI